MTGPVLTGSCHCGAVSFSLAVRPEQIVDCNCSACSRYRALWSHMPVDQVAVIGETIAYSHGDENLAFHSCANCGGTTHWSPIRLQPDTPWMAVNLAMAEPSEIADLPLRHFDGADSWKFLD